MKPSFRRKLIQLASALIYNANLKGFGKGSLYQGQTKGMCVPGLNCYSCPGAIGSCPLGTLQNALGSFPKRFPFYILGLLMLFGLLFGRLICGFLCPFGLIQELLHKIPTPKLKKNRVTRLLSYMKYIILGVFVVYLPIYYAFSKGFAVPAFCKYVCPAGTLEAGLPLIAADSNLRSIIGVLFSWKVLVLIFIIIVVIFIYRGFCRFICPLGAIYGFFARISIFGMKVDEHTCTHCNKCIRHCPMDIKKVGDHECIQCGSCKSICPENAICRKPGKTPSK